MDLLSQIQQSPPWQKMSDLLKNCCVVFITPVLCGKALPPYLHLTEDEVHLQSLTRGEIEQVQAMPEFLRSDWLGEHISCILICVNLLNGDLTCSNPISNPVIHNSNVFCLGMVYLILRQTYGALTVAVYQNQIASLEASVSAMYSASVVDNAIVD